MIMFSVGAFLGAATSALAASNSSLRSDGTILRNGQPFFPLGFYHTHESSVTGQAYLNEVQAIPNSHSTLQAGGFNLIVNKGWGFTWPDYAPMATDAANKGISIATGGPEYNTTYYVDFVQQFKNYDAIQFWELQDDADNGETYSNGYTRNITNTRDRYNRVKAADPNHLAVVSLTGWSQARRDAVASWVDTSDILELQSYPIAKPGGLTSAYPLADNYSWLSKAYEAAKPSGKPIIAALQAFPWSLEARNQPTVAQERNLTYGALAAGAKGIHWYSLYETGAAWWIPRDDANLWAELQSLRNDIDSLKGVLLDGDFTRNVGGYTDTAGGLIASRWIHRGKVYFIANNYGTGSLAGSVALPAGAQTTFVNVLPRLGSHASDSISNGRLNIYLGAAGVRVYQIGLPQLLSNPEFATGDLQGWNTWSANNAHADADYAETNGGGKYDAYHGTHWKATSYDISTYQTRTGLSNGSYTLRAWVRRGGSPLASDIIVMTANGYDSGGSQLWVNIPATGGWVPVVIRNIPVANGQCTIHFYSKTSGGKWMHFDAVEFWKQ
jgi:hypothetical protein